jgi:hypothetical protein
MRIHRANGSLPHRACAKAKHRSPSEGAKPTGHSFKPMIACWRVGLAAVIGQAWLGLPVPSLGGLPVGCKHSAESQNCLAYGKELVRQKCQHLPPCRGWPRLSYWAWVVGQCCPALLPSLGGLPVGCP